MHGGRTARIADIQRVLEHHRCKLARPALIDTRDFTPVLRKLGSKIHPVLAGHGRIVRDANDNMRLLGVFVNDMDGSGS